MTINKQKDIKFKNRIIMTDRMIKYLASLTRQDAIDFFREEKDKEKYLAESKEFYEALWDRFLELLKQES